MIMPAGDRVVYKTSHLLGHLFALLTGNKKTKKKTKKKTSNTVVYAFARCLGQSKLSFLRRSWNSKHQKMHAHPTMLLTFLDYGLRKSRWE